MTCVADRIAFRQTWSSMASGKEHIVPWLIPPSWVWTTIGQITSIVAGRSPRGNHPEYFGGGIVWLKAGELKDGIVRKSAQPITRTGLASMGASVLPRGTICIACSGQIGRASWRERG